MKAAFCVNIFPHNEIMNAACRLAQMGYHGIELWDAFLMGQDLEEVKNKLTAFKLEVAQMCPYFNFTGNAEELETTMEIARKYIDMARFLDCKRIRVFTGNRGSCEVDEKTYWQAVEGLKAVCGMAKDIQFILETHDKNLTDTGPATVKLLNDTGMDNLKVNLQVPLDYGKEDVYESARMLGEHVAHLHAHNWIGGWPKLTYLDSGDYDFRKFVEILSSKGFDGYISIEHGDHMGTKDPFEVAQHEIKYLKQVFGI